MSDLAELLERVRAAPMPDRELDALIYVSMFVPKDAGRIDVLGGLVGYWPKNAPYVAAVETPAYTASIDAALALTERVLPGWTWTLDKFGALPSHAPGFRCVLKRADEWLSSADAKAPTAPLAILAATLSAIRNRGENP